MHEKLGKLSDLVAVNDNIIYFTKSNQEADSLTMTLEAARGQVYLLDTRATHFYEVITRGHLFMPRCLAYLREERMLAVSNLAVQGLSLYKREYDNSLSWMRDVNVGAFVWNVLVYQGLLWLSTHPALHETVTLASSEKHVAASQLVKMTLDFRHSREVEVTERREYFATDGSLLGALSAAVVFRDRLMLFSFIGDPRVCLMHWEHCGMPFNCWCSQVWMWINRDYVTLNGHNASKGFLIV